MYRVTQDLTLLNVSGVEHQVSSGTRFEVKLKYGYGVVLLDQEVYGWKPDGSKVLIATSIAIGQCDLTEHLESGAVEEIDDLLHLEQHI